MVFYPHVKTLALAHNFTIKGCLTPPNACTKPVRYIYMWSLFLIFRMNFGIVPRMWYFVFILFSHLVYMYLCTLTFSRKIYNTPMNFYVVKIFRHHSEIRLWFWKNKHVVEKTFWTKIIWLSVCECKNTCSWNWKTRVYQYICVLGYVKHPTVYIQTQWITWIWGIVDNKSSFRLMK